MKVFPDSTLVQLEFDKIRELLAQHCKTEWAKNKALALRIHTRIEYIQQDLQQAAEYKILLASGQHFPNDFHLNIQRELKLLSIPGALLSGEQVLHIRSLAQNTAAIFRWFNEETQATNPALSSVIADCYYEKSIVKMIDSVLDATGQVMDSASEDLAEIRMKIFRKRNELRKIFDRIVRNLNKQGYLADIEESFLNGRRVLAVFAEQKRMVKGVLHGESDSRRTSFIEPEETTSYNNEIYSLEIEEQKEVQRILRKLTADLSVYAGLLQEYFKISGEFDFIQAKAQLALSMRGEVPVLKDQAHIHLIKAYHPLLYLYNQNNKKPTIPVTLKLDHQQRIIVISGPNAGGKTVTMKTVGLIQLMMQAGLLVPLSPDSEMGIFKQLMIHMGDTQSLEFELSTYSSHLQNMKYFMENANGKTLFFIDELGSGSDPNLGGAFAEVIMEELAFKKAFGIVTTHYLNLKIMANKVKGIINGAMQFDEVNLKPLYKLQIGKPGSSYTFSIAERIGLNKKLIDKARSLVNDQQYRLDKLLNKTEQEFQTMQADKIQLQNLLTENEKLKTRMQKVVEKELHKQEVEKLQLQNRISADKIIYLKDMERKLKSLVIAWKKTEDKEELIKTMRNLLFQQKEKMQKEKQQKKLNEKFIETGGEIAIGDKVKMKQNRQVGIVKELKGKKALLQVGVMPMLVSMTDLVKVIDKPNL